MMGNILLNTQKPPIVSKIKLTSSLSSSFPSKEEPTQNLKRRGRNRTERLQNGPLWGLLEGYLGGQAEDSHAGLVKVNTRLSCSYPQSHKAGCTGDRAQRRGMFRVYGIRRKKFFSRIDSHVIDVLKVDRRGDQTGVMMRGWVREAWLRKQQRKQ